jgi:hypothetical protein
MSTSRHYKRLMKHRQLSKYEGIASILTKAAIAQEELVTWISTLTPEERQNLLHIKTLGKMTGIEISMLLRVRSYEYETQTRRRKNAIAKKEKEELQAEEAIVRSLMQDA